MSYLYPLIAFLVSLVVTTVGMPLLLRLCKSRGLYDMPNERKVHHNCIPRLGGAFFAPAMLLGVVVAFAVMLLMGIHLPEFGAPSFFILAGIFLIYLIGLVDDVLGLNARIKFFVQFVSALFMPVCGICLNNLYGLFGIYELPLWAGYPLTVFVSLLIINSINLIDGIDGLAGCLSFIALGIFAYLYYSLDVLSYSIMAMALMGTVLAFLYYNMFGKVNRNTKTFMGDTGSLILGYALSFFAIKLAMDKEPLLPYNPDSLLVSFTLLFVPVLDLIRVAIMRLLRGVSIFYADKTHIHHKLMATGLSMHGTLVAILSLQLFFIGFNFGARKMCLGTGWIMLMDILLFTGVILAVGICSVDKDKDGL